MGYFIFWFALVLALLDWWAVLRDWRGVEMLTKPAVMLALLVLLWWLWWSGGVQGAVGWFALGLALSMLGDIFLLKQVNRLIPGLISFLLAHVAYIVGFSLAPMVFSPLLLVAGVAILLIYFFYTRLLVSRLEHSGKNQKMKVPVIVYGAVISVMLFSAVACFFRPAWSSTAALIAALGAAFFFTSDAILAWDRFAAKIPYGRLLNMVAYHIGQFAIIAGAVLALLR